MAIFNLNFLLKVGQVEMCQNPSPISTISSVIGRGEKMFGSCGGFRFGVRIIYGTAVFIKSVF